MVECGLFRNLSGDGSRAVLLHIVLHTEVMALTVQLVLCRQRLIGFLRLRTPSAVCHDVESKADQDSLQTVL